MPTQNALNKSKHIVTLHRDGDRDGNWTDLDGDGVYNIDPHPNLIVFEHSNGTGDWGPEIWLARIDPYSISDSAIHLDSLKAFFKDLSDTSDKLNVCKSLSSILEIALTRLVLPTEKSPKSSIFFLIICHFP